MKIYLDMCCVQRVVDSKTQLRILMEAQAVLGILSLCNKGTWDLVFSDPLRFELDRNPHPFRKQYAWQVFSKAQIYVANSPVLVERAAAYRALGIKALDALHLASAVEARADFFCTCDDRLLKRARTAATLTTEAVSPLELIMDIEA